MFIYLCIYLLSFRHVKVYNTTNFKVVHNLDYAASILSLALAVRHLIVIFLQALKMRAVNRSNVTYDMKQFIWVINWHQAISAEISSDYIEQNGTSSPPAVGMIRVLGFQNNQAALWSEK